MPSLPIDIYKHSSRLLGSIKTYYMYGKEAGMSSPPRSHTLIFIVPRAAMGSTSLTGKRHVLPVGVA